jgi:hypothetical protein
MLRLAWCGCYKKRIGTCYAELVFLHLMRYSGHVVCSGTSGARNLDALFFMLGLARCGCHKKRADTHLAKLVFLHPVRSTGHVVRSGVSRA